MYDRAYDIYETIISNSDSVLIILLIVLTLAVIVAVIPLYNLVLKGRREDKEHDETKQDKYIEREREIINVMREIGAVIAENTAITSGLKPILENHGMEIKQAIGLLQGYTVTMLTDVAETKANARAILSAVGGKMPTDRDKEVKI